MELINYFDKFLVDTVNLNKSRIDKLNEKEIILRDFIKASDNFKNIYKDMQQQGSLSQKTIIKPATDSKGFDADLALMLEKNPKWEAKDYLIELHKIFKE
ncbi:MAG: nucleotidyltransferase, partial [Bacteroidetes bacterium]|nr:nucleotidyltransferase [Bacteroidota bacterium]